MRKGQVMSEEQKLKIAQSHIGIRPNANARLKMSLAKRGQTAWNKGQPLTAEWKLRVSQSKKGTPAWNKGKKMSVATRAKMQGNKNGSANKGRVMSPEWIDKLSLAKKGKPSFFLGKKHSKATREKMSKKITEAFLKECPDYKPSSRRIRTRVRRGLIRKNGGHHTANEWKALKLKYNLTCPCCLKKEPEIKLTRDHIIAVLKGGTDDIGNIQPLCIVCNSKKRIKTIRY